MTKMVKKKTGGRKMNHVDTIIKSEAIFTGLDDAPFKGAIAISGDKIFDVVKGQVPDDWSSDDTKIIDCGNKLVMPGLIDAHFHFFMGTCANSRYMTTDIEKSTSEEDCIRIVKEYEKANPDLNRLMGWGWFLANWNGAPLPTKESLDKAFPDKELILFCADGHTVWLNSKGLEACGIDENTVPVSGEVVLGDDGKPNGILMEGAGLIALEKMSDFSVDVMKEIYAECFEALAQRGVTTISDISVPVLSDEYRELVKRLKQMEEEGLFTSRLNLYTRLRDVPDYGEEIALREKYGKDGLVRYAGFKHVIDGVTSTFTGLMLEPYSDKPESCGDPANFEKSFYVEAVKKANAEGIGVRLHCVGDRAVRWALDAFEESNKANNNPGNKKELKNTIEHIETIHPDDIPRFKELGVIASMQPFHLTLDANEKIYRVGDERVRWEWPHRSLLDSGARLAFGTDYPTVHFDPFENIYSAVTRKDTDRKPTGVNPEECISLAETLKCYTVEGAYTYDMSDEIGTLEKGKQADIITLDCNLFNIPEDEIPNANVEHTFLSGKEVYSIK